MDNFIVTASNLYALRAIYQADKNRSSLDAAILTGALTASMVYHALEISKHDMSGVPAYRRYERAALWLDRVLAAAAVARFMIAYNNRIDRGIVMLGLASVACLMLSECQHVFDIKKYTGRALAKAIYITSHCLWHVGAFHVAYVILAK